MGAKFQNTTPPTNRSQIFFKLLLNVLPNVPHKIMFGIFEVLKFEILTIFFRFR